MADKKISQMTLLSAADLDPAADYLPIVDPSEPNAADQNKRILAQSLLSGGLAATVANGVVYVNGSELLTTGSGLQFNGANLGLGVTPSAWGSLYRAVQMPAGVSVAGRTDGGIEGVFSTNCYRDSGGTWRYTNNGVARRYVQEADGHLFFVAPSGTAGDAISFTQAMVLDASGNLGVGRAPTSARMILQQNASGATRHFQIENATNNTLLQFGSESGLNTIDSNRSTSAAALPLAIQLGGTEVARWDASGNIIQKLNASAPTLGTNSTMTFELTSNTSLTVKVRGSDGTTRSVALTLA